MDRSRSVRIFLSSTFRDFGEERDLLVRKVFPALRSRLKDRFVELVDVDLRWGITVEQVETVGQNHWGRCSIVCNQRTAGRGQLTFLATYLSQ